MKTDKCFVRNEGYIRPKIDNVEKHNERENERYGNGDVRLDRSTLNVHYKCCEGSYLAAFDKLEADGIISTWNLKSDSKIMDEFIFDVNTEYFDRNGGYEYAKRFYEDCYCFAVAEAGGEDFIISAVMHADERNGKLSEQLGRDIYHYHLHVVYVPVVDKEIKWSVRCKNPELVGKVKAVVKQVNNTKRWESKMETGEDGKRHLAYSYAGLQDRFHQHLQATGYTDIARGDRGSTAEHLEVLDFKIKQDTQRLDAISEQVEKKEAQADKLDAQITVKEKAKATIEDINDMGHTLPLVPGIHFTDEEAKRLKSLARKGIGKDKRADTLNKKITELEGTIRDKDGEISDWKRSHSSLAADRDAWRANYNTLMGEVSEFIPAIRKIPNRLRAFMEEQKQAVSRNKEVAR